MPAMPGIGNLFSGKIPSTPPSNNESLLSHSSPLGDTQIFYSVFSLINYTVMSYEYNSVTRIPINPNFQSRSGIVNAHGQLIVTGWNLAPNQAITASLVNAMVHFCNG